MRPLEFYSPKFFRLSIYLALVLAYRLDSRAGVLLGQLGSAPAAASLRVQPAMPLVNSEAPDLSSLAPIADSTSLSPLLAGSESSAESDDPAPPTVAQALSAYWAAFAGVDVSGASSTDAKAVFLGSVLVDLPLTGDGKLEAAKRSIPWLGGQLRIAGMAQPGNLSGNLGSLSAATTYLSSATNATPDKIVQSVEGNMSVGLQFFDHTLTTTPNTWFFTGSAVITVGAITPLSADQSNPPVYVLTNQILQQFAGEIQGNNPSACAYTTGTPTCYVAFIPTDRTHFYRHYEAGVRLKLYEMVQTGQYTFPGSADLAIGQNEYVTKGKLSGFVLHFGGVFPIPGVQWLYMFGSMDTTLSGESLKDDEEQLLLSPAPASANLTFLSPTVFTIPVTQPERDRYRLGFGIDIFHLIASKGK